MSTMVVELYEALKRAGVEDGIARDAARAVVGVEQRAELVTTHDLRMAMAQLETSLIKWNVGALVALTGIFSAIVKLL